MQSPQNSDSFKADIGGLKSVTIDEVKIELTDLNMLMVLFYDTCLQ